MGKAQLQILLTYAGDEATVMAASKEHRHEVVLLFTAEGVRGRRIHVFMLPFYTACHARVYWNDIRASVKGDCHFKTKVHVSPLLLLLLTENWRIIVDNFVSWWVTKHLH